MRYQCKECGQEQTGETDCLKHTLKYGHKEFLDSENQGSTELEGEGIPTYCPLDDPDILDD